MIDKVITLMGFSAKAGKLSYGMDAAIAAACGKKSKLLLCASDISQKSKKEIIYYGNKYSVIALVLDGFNIKTVSDAVGRKCGIISVNDSGFADAIKKAYAEGGNANDQ